MEYQVRAARHHVNGVDLQQAHAPDRRHHIVAAGPSSHRLQQALSKQLQCACLDQTQHVSIT
jgi:hypothetical protein